MTITRRIPAEWEKHQGTLISFPHNSLDWPGKLSTAQWAFVEMIRKISVYEKVFVNVKHEQHADLARKMLQQAWVDLQAVEFIPNETNRNWMRDSGPIVVLREDGSREALKFKFNGWAKYRNHTKDQTIPEAVASHLGISCTQVMHKGKPVVLEGGSIDINGCGTLITTEECLLDQKVQVRNPGLTKDDYAAIFAEYLGISNVIWLGDGIAGDDTHGHVDDICRFVNRNTLVAVRESNPADENYSKLEANLELLKDVRLENGEKPEVVAVPMPAKLCFNDMRLPASYVNFLVTNGSVLVPTFNDPNDYKALGILSELFPGRVVNGIHAVDLVLGQGTLHCLSHEIPA